MASNMSTVIFAEGKHDVDFLKVIHQRFAGKNYDIFIDQEAGDSQDIRVRQHKLDTKIEYLYKSEGGRSEVIKKFRANPIEFREFKFIILVDLDGDDISDFMDRLHEKLKEHWSDRIIVNPQKTNQNAHLLFYVCEVLVNDTVEYEFDLIAFRESLETVTHIYDENDRSRHLDKINYYIDHCPCIIEDVADILF